MEKRYASIWFRYLKTDWFASRHPALKELPFVLAEISNGRKVITAVSPLAAKEGISTGMAVADARAIVPALHAVDDVPGLQKRLLTAIGLWCDRFTPVVAVDEPDGLLLEVTGCAHLWGGEAPYLHEITRRLQDYGYHTHIGIAGTIGTAWAVARYSKQGQVPNNVEAAALSKLPPAALRVESAIQEKLLKLGLREIAGFMSMEQSALRRRFGKELLLRLHQALGVEPEVLIPLIPPAEYHERLPCLEPIRTAAGIEMAIQTLLERLCARLQKESKGIRQAVLRGCRVDGHTVSIGISTVRPSLNTQHLFKLFEQKVPQLEPDLGIELFTLEAGELEDMKAFQESLFEITGSLTDAAIAELVDRLTGKLPGARIRRYLPAEHHWPELAIRATTSLTEQPATAWPVHKQRPVELLDKPQRIEVTAPIPDYPPMLFLHKGIRHKIKKADGPERMRRAWWINPGQHRDYYAVEDEQGQRYWIFRSGHYDAKQPPEWFLHGYFA
jgi:protein ImuB